MADITITQGNSITIKQADQTLVVQTVTLSGSGVVTYSTEVSLLATTLPDGSLAYAVDTDTHWARQNGAWVKVATGTAVEVFATEVALLAAIRLDGALGYATDTDTHWVRQNGAWLKVATGAAVTPYATEAALLAATLPDGSLAYAIDTATHWARQGGAWLKVATGSTVLLFATEAALLAATPADGALAYAANTASHWGRQNGTWQKIGTVTTDVAGWVYVAGVTVSGGSVTSQVWADPPANTVLQSATVSALSISVQVRASYPLVTINGVPATLTRDVGGGYYSGSVPTTLVGAGPVRVVVLQPDGNDGAVDTVTLAVDLPPQILTLSFTGGYPGVQTELKAGDSFQLTGTADKAINAVDVLDFGAFSPTLVVVPSGTSFTVTGTVANRGTTLQALAARVRVRDAVTAAFSIARDTNQGGGTVDGVNLVNLNNLYPTATFGTITYPVSQGALKGAESASAAVTLANLTSVTFDSPNGDVSITNPALIEASKTVTRIAGSYNIAVNNLRATATRAANAAITIAQTIVRIANTASVITVSPATARIRSGVAPGNDTTISIISDQQLFVAPTLSPAVGRGTFQGGGFAGGPSTWTRVLRVLDSENPMNGSANTWLGLVATNLAGIVTSVITTGTTYVIGGFTSRTLSFAPFLANSTEFVPLTDQTKLSAGSFSNGNASVRQPFGTADTSDIGKEGWYAPSAASGLVYLHMLHVPTAGAHSGTLTLPTVQEAV